MFAIGANVRSKIWKDAAMSRANYTSKPTRRSKTLPALGAAGLSLALTSGAHAATDGTAVDRPALNTVISQEISLAEEEISDVSLSTFYVFDKENAQKPQLGQQLAWGGCRCGGCRCGGADAGVDALGRADAVAEAVVVAGVAAAAVIAELIS
jgi:hypothetical protein